MEKITIEKDKHGFIVRQGDKYADWLCYDEMFGIVVSLIMKDDPSIISRYGRDDDGRTTRKMGT